MYTCTYTYVYGPRYGWVATWLHTRPFYFCYKFTALMSIFADESPLAGCHGAEEAVHSKATNQRPRSPLLTLPCQQVTS